MGRLSMGWNGVVRSRRDALPPRIRKLPFVHSFTATPALLCHVMSTARWLHPLTDAAAQRAQHP